MKDKRTSPLTATELATQPFFYEIRVRGQLSGEQWSEWFNDLAITTTGGETTLRGVLPDHAALYALLARLRDLAIPLLAVNVLDAEARRKLHLRSRRYTLAINLMLLVVYLMLLGGMAAITTFLTSSQLVDTALALALLFAAIGGLAYAFSVWSGLKMWRWITYGMWPASVLTFLIFTSVTRILPPAIAISLILFLSAGGLIYLIYYLRARADQINEIVLEWRALGSTRRDEPRR
jgi:hypothetical protein